MDHGPAPYFKGSNIIGKTDESHMHDSLMLPCTIHNLNLDFLVDTGATISLLRPEKYYAIPEDKRPLLEPYTTKIRMGDGASINALGCAIFPLNIGGSLMPQKMVVANIEVAGVLGYDFLYENGVDINVREGSLSMHGITIKCQLESKLPAVFRINTCETVTIPANSEMIIRGKVHGVQIQETDSKPVLIESDGGCLGEKNVLVARSLVLIQGMSVPLRLANLSNVPQTIYNNTFAAKCEPVEIVEEGGALTPSASYCRTETTVEEQDDIPVHLQGLYEMSKENLSEEERGSLRVLLKKHGEGFSKYKGDIGRTSLVEHRIFVGDSAPIKQAPRRLPPVKRTAATEEIKKMLAQDLITPSKSAWSSPITLVKKKDSTYRFCIDYRKLNDVTRKDCFPLPRTDDSLDALGGNKYFSVMDLSSGYWQVGVHKDDQDKTAFATADGLYNFRVMPYGLFNSGATFQRLMELILSGLHWSTCLLYVDDIICFSKTVDEHIMRLDEILTRIRDAGLKLSPGKCKFFQREVSFLGNIVSERGIATDPEKIRAVKEWPTPKNVHELRAFLGTASYYRRYCKGFSDIARPLHKLTEKGKPYLWSDECQNSFDELKRMLTSAPVLGYPRQDIPFILDCDASGYGTGSILSQIQDGEERVISYYSKSMSKSERNYCVTRRELLAVVNAVKHYHHFLYGNKFTIRTDHSAVKFFLRFKNPEGQISRWLEILSAYNFEIQHRAGRLHGNSDGLSRIPCGMCVVCKRQETKSEQANMSCHCNHASDHQGENHKIMSPLSKQSRIGERGHENTKAYLRVTTRSQTGSSATWAQWLSSRSAEDIAHAQQTDEKIKTILRWLNSSPVRPPWESVSHLDGNMKAYWAHWDRLKLQNNILYSRWFDEVTGTEQLVLVVPEAWRHDILKMVHSDPGLGHFGVKKTLDRLRRRAYWPSMARSVSNFCENCDRCQARKQPAKTPRAPLKVYRSGLPNERVQIDIVGPMTETYHMNKYLIVMFQTSFLLLWSPLPFLQGHSFPLRLLLL